MRREIHESSSVLIYILDAEIIMRARSNMLVLLNLCYILVIAENRNIQIYCYSDIFIIRCPIQDTNNRCLRAVAYMISPFADTSPSRLVSNKTCSDTAQYLLQWPNRKTITNYEQSTTSVLTDGVLLWQHPGWHPARWVHAGTTETGQYTWASYQIRKIAGWARAGNAGNVFPDTDFKGNC